MPFVLSLEGDDECIYKEGQKAHEYTQATRMVDLLPSKKRKIDSAPVV